MRTAMFFTIVIVFIILPSTIYASDKKILRDEFQLNLENQTEEQDLGTPILKLDLLIEYRVGLNSYDKISDLELTVQQGRPTAFIIEHQAAEYTTRFEIYGHELDFRSNLKPWAISVFTENTGKNGNQISPTKETRFFLDQGEKKRIETSDLNNQERRDIAITLTY